jgi:hypothetical protein
MRKRISRVMISGALSLSLCICPIVSVMGEEVFVEESTEASEEAAYSESVFSSEEGYSQDVTASEGENVIEEVFYSEEEGSSDEAYYSEDLYFSEDVYDSVELIDSDEGSAEEAWAEDAVYEETGAEEENEFDEPGVYEELLTAGEDSGTTADYAVITEQDFIAAVEVIPGTVTLSVSHSVDIVKARALYLLLTDEQKKLSKVKSALAKLEAAEEAMKTKVNQSISDKMQDLVNALPSVTASDVNSAIEKARKAIADLGGDQTELLSGIRTKLEKAKADLNKAVKEANKDAVEKIRSSIISLPSQVSSGIKDGAEALIQAYKGLTEDQIKLIDDNTKKTLDEIVSKLENLMTQESLDKIAAQVVGVMISMLQAGDKSSVTDKEDVELVKEAYTKLTTAQKALLPEAEATLNSLLKQAEDEEKAKTLSDSIAKIGDAKAGEGKKAVENAEKTRAGLSEDQLALVPKEDLATLDRAIKAYAEGRTFVVKGAKYQVLSNGNLTYAGPEDKTITSVSVPNQIKKGGFMFKVEQISEAALKECKNLRWVVLHQNIKIIGKNAFANTPNLEMIKVMSKLFETGRVVSAFAEAGMNKGAGLTVKTPRGYASTYEKLFVGEGKLNKKALVIEA